MFRRFVDALRRRRRDDGLIDELALHEELKRQELLDRGLSPADARLGARRALGSVAIVHDRRRDLWRFSLLRDLGRDITSACRRLTIDRRFTLSVVGILALGIGASNTVFTMVNTIVIRPIPFERPDQLVAVGVRDGNGRDMPASFPDFQDWRAGARSFDGLFGEIGTAMNLSGETSAPERVAGSYISANAFRVLGRAPILGRDFIESDDRIGASPVAILGYGLWQSRYAGDPAIIGRLVRVNDVPSTVIAVMPAGFAFPIASEIWQPLALFNGIERATRTGQPRLAAPSVFGRLLPEVSMAQAQSDLAGIAEQIARDFPDTNGGITPAIKPLREALPLAGLARLAWLLTAAVGFLLLIACANVANLLLSRAIHRVREVAIRQSLGATRWRIIRQHLIESAVLAFAGGALGLALSIYGVRLVASAFADPLSQAQPYWLNWSMDLSVLLFIVAACATTPLLFGLLPAVFVSRAHDIGSIKDGGHGAVGGARARRWTGGLVILELALTMVLLVGTGLMLRSLQAIVHAGTVVDTAEVLTMRLAIANAKYPGPEDRRRFFEQLQERLTALPDAVSATVASDVPLMTLGAAALMARQLEISGRPTESGAAAATVHRVYMEDRYFETLGVRPLLGRGLEARDGFAGQEGAVVNDRFARLFFAGQNVIGERIRLTANGSPPGPWLTIVGVTPTIAEQAADTTPQPVVYVSIEAEPAPHRFAAIIARGRPGAVILPSIRAAVQAVDADLPVYFVQSLDQLLGVSQTWHRFISTMFGVFAIIAVVLASAGLYAVTSYGVTQRAREIGIRMALGALPRQVMWLLGRGLLIQLAIGLTAGLGGAFVLGRVLESVLVRTGAHDPLTLASTVALLIVVSIAACLIPARGATRVEPMAVLRTD